jgi:hypothetical protein
MTLARRLDYDPRRQRRAGWDAYGLEIDTDIGKRR